jgi:DNA-binding HxlR family transcriptional regulator
VPAQVDYRLTETGAGLTHLVKALPDWSLTHRSVIAEARLAYDRAHPDHDIR